MTSNKFFVFLLIVFAGFSATSFAQSSTPQTDSQPKPTPIPVAAQQPAPADDPEAANTDTHSATHIQPPLRLPEPMVYDLVRPLNAQKGELEINSLFLNQLSRTGQTTEWAPEIEYAFLDRYAVELEFPFEGQHLGAYKLALQGTFKNESTQFVHGWQWIGLYNKHGRSKIFDGVYLAGYQITPSVSVFSMTGARFTRTQRQTRAQALFNPSMFYNARTRLTLGMETNLAMGKREERQQLFMPQSHVTLTKRYSFQFGAGATRHGTSTPKPVMGFRLVVTLNGGAGH
jgi:hypothetical protein